MKQMTRKRIGRTLQLVSPLTPAERAIAERWFRNVPFSLLVEMRMRGGCRRFCLLPGGKGKAPRAVSVGAFGPNEPRPAA